jgi:excisionase family DNA binding protein
MDRPFYTTNEAAEALGVTAGRVRQMVIDGSIAAEKVGRDLLIPASEVERARSRKTKPGPTAAEATPAPSKKVKRRAPQSES